MAPSSDDRVSAGRPAGTGAAGVAVFDFDRTLILGDSLWPFLILVAGRRRACAALGRALGAGLGQPRPASAIKATLVAHTLAGVPVATALDAAERLRPRLRWRRRMVEALDNHHRAGHRVVVASGALALYLERLIVGVPVSAVLATALDVQSDVLTGRLASPNCVGAEKAARVATWLAANRPHGPTWGYGNRPSDLPMLALVDHPTIV